MADTSASCDQVDLARETPFALGGLVVDPARLSVARGADDLRLEARVMQVLVVLAKAGGQVVSRAELVERCWVGRIVGENAIQRVVSRLRHVSASLGGFELETIPKVGYLLRPAHAEAPGAPPEPPPPTAPLPGPVTALPPAAVAVSRRGLFWATGAIAAGGAAILAWPLTASPNPNAEAARRLVAKAHEAQLTGQREANSQAIAYLKRATELDPKSAVAWGDLALAHQQRLEHSDDGGLAELADWVRSAAARALAIDPQNVSARLALATILPNFRHWASNERALRQIERSGASHPSLDDALGWLLCDTGRWQEAAACYRRALAFEPYNPMNRLVLAATLWGAGELDQVEALLETTFRLWPNNRWIWMARFEFLALTGRGAAAVALVDDASARPVISPDETPPPFAALRDFALTMQNGRSAAAGELGDLLITLRSGLGTAAIVTYMCALGRIYDAYSTLDGYFFGGATRPPPPPLARRKTAILFAAKAAPLRTDARYPELLRRIGLVAYWRETGTRSDRRLGAVHA